jgi:hypothetical protein
MLILSGVWISAMPWRVATRALVVLWGALCCALALHIDIAVVSVERGRVAAHAVLTAGVTTAVLAGVCNRRHGAWT